MDEGSRNFPYFYVYLNSEFHISGLAQDCGNSIANALELPQFYAKQSI